MSIVSCIWDMLTDPDIDVLRPYGNPDDPPSDRIEP